MVSKMNAHESAERRKFFQQSVFRQGAKKEAGEIRRPIQSNLIVLIRLSCPQIT